MVNSIFINLKNSCIKIIKNPLVINYSIIVLISYTLTIFKPSLLPVSNLTLLITSLTSLIFIYILNSFLRLLPKKAYIIIGAIIASFFAILTIINSILYLEFYEFLSYDFLHFIYQDPQYVLDYLHTYLDVFIIMILLCLFIVFFLPWFFITDYKRKINYIKKTILVSIAMYLVHISATEILVSMSQQTFVNYGSKSVISIIESIKGKFSGTFVYSKNKTISNLKEQVPYNILFIPAESFGRIEGLSFYGHNNNAMPFLANFINQNKDEIFLFKSAYTNSSATDVSMPSIFTGLHPNDSIDMFSTFPLAWDWGKAGNMYTFLVSSHRYNWAHFKELFLYEPPDYYQVAETLKGKIAHGVDSGLDDLGVVEYVRQALEANKNKQPFLGIFHPLGLHSPFQSSSSYCETPKNLNRYQTALYFFDQTLKKIITYLSEYNQLDNTIIIITSDHGELSHSKRRQRLARIYSFYETYQHIPLIMYIPKEINIDTQFLKENTQKNVQNLDLIPTMIDLLGFRKSDNYRDFFNTLEGTSLLKKLPHDRILSSLNTNDFRNWNSEGFCIIYKSYRLVVSTAEGIQLFNISVDPNQKNNIWEKSDIIIKEKLIKEINEKKHLKRIWKSVVNKTFS